MSWDVVGCGGFFFAATLLVNFTVPMTDPAGAAILMLT